MPRPLEKITVCTIIKGQGHHLVGQKTSSCGFILDAYKASVQAILHGDNDQVATT